MVGCRFFCILSACLSICLAKRPASRTGDVKSCDDGDESALLQVKSANGGNFRWKGSSPPGAGQRWHPKIHAYIRYLEALEASDDFDLSSLEGASLVSPDSNGTLLFLVLSDSNAYGTRLKWISDSWAQDVHSSLLVAIGDYADASGTDNVRVEPTRCPAHSHDGACCKEGEAVINAHQLLQQQPSLNWAYIVDDDAYVRPSAMEAKLKGIDPIGDHGRGTMAATLGCVTKNCQTGICGGGGIALSREALDSLIGDSPAAYFKQHMETCDRCEMWGDVTLGTQAFEHSISMVQLEGTNAWTMNKQLFDTQLQEADTQEPLMYHYIKSEGQMRFLHHLFSNSSSSSAQSSGATDDTKAAPKLLHTLEEFDSSCANYRGHVHCTSDPLSLPWSGVEHPAGFPL